MNFEVLYSAAHADFPDSEPLGGRKAVADYLIREWRGRNPFPLAVLSPKSVGLDRREATRVRTRSLQRIDRLFGLTCLQT